MRRSNLVNPISCTGLPRPSGARNGNENSFFRGFILKDFLSSLLETIYPNKCIMCDAIRSTKNPLCDDCTSKTIWLDSNFFSSKLIKQIFDNGLSLAAYDGEWQEVIHRFKYNNRTDLAKPLAAMLSERVNSEYDMIVPVPLSGKKLRRRGYNQSALLAKEIGRLCGFECAFDLIKKEDTLPQVGLAQEDRLKNIKGAFALSSRDITGKSLLIIDDVMTTGATVNECAKVLKNGGAARVDVLTLARTV